MRKHLIVLTVFIFPAILSASLKPGEFYTSGSSHSKRIALTFDDGPGADTPKYLDLLDRYHVKATFFVLGDCTATQPSVVADEIRRGHEVGSHTYNHTNYKAKYKSILQKMTSAGKGESEAKAEAMKELLADMKKSDAIIRKAANQKIILCRMPHGIDRPWIKETAKEMGYALVNWTYGADWTPQPYEKLLPGYLSAIRPGAIILLHDGGKDRSKSLRITEAILQHAQKQGYEIVPVGELLSK